jgi:hypothetical protein
MMTSNYSPFGRDERSLEITSGDARLLSGEPEKLAVILDCGCIEDDLYWCRRCKKAVPEEECEPVVTYWKRSWWRRKIKVTHWICKDGCNAVD